MSLTDAIQFASQFDCPGCKELSAALAASEQRGTLNSEALTAIIGEHERDHTEGNVPRHGCTGCAMVLHLELLEDKLLASEQRVREQEEAFEVWSGVVCQHGPGGTHASLADLARCLLAQLQASEREAARLREALTDTLSALEDLVRQLPNDDRLADYSLDFAEVASFKARAALAPEAGG